MSAQLFKIQSAPASRKAGFPHCGFEGDHFRPGGLAGAHSGGDVFDHDAFRSGESEDGGAFQIGLGMGLAVGDVVGGDQLFRQGQAGGADADLGKGTRAGGNDGPAIVGKAGQQL